MYCTSSIWEYSRFYEKLDNIFQRKCEMGFFFIYSTPIKTSEAIRRKESLNLNESEKKEFY